VQEAGMKHMNTNEIIVGSRVRGNMGDMAALEASIAERGMLQPIGVTAERELIFGARRLLAAKSLGLAEVPVRVIDVDAEDPAAALKIERDENEVRRDFSPMEKAEIARRIEMALGRRHGGDRRSNQGGTRSTLNEVGKSRDIAAKAVGWSGRQYEKAKAVADSGDDELVAAVDSGAKSVGAAYNEVKQRTAPRNDKPLVFKIRLNADLIESEANSLVSAAGHDAALSFAHALIRACGHSVEIDQ
jgi:ParB family chromosome partitioning protein